MTHTNSLKETGQLTHTLLDASAGTGKTSQLVKRTLRAYLVCETPDQVLDLTFTNKAAAEMRQRIVSELKNAELSLPVSTPHEQELRGLAEKVLARDKQLNWNILKNPNQLEIKTFDSLCSSIVSQAPVTSKIGGAAKVAVNPVPIYKQAADELLRDYKKGCDWSEDVQRLLSHVNNSFESASALLVELLGSRDQWLPIVLQAKNTEQRREALENNNLKLVNVLFKPLISAVKEVESDIHQMINYANSNADAKLQSTLRPVLECQLLPSSISDSNDLDVYNSLVDFFVSQSKQPTFYKKLNKSKGFPAVGSIKEQNKQALAESQKDLGESVLLHLRESGLELWLPAICKVNGFRYSEQEWQLLDSLISLLPVLASRLLLTFKHIGQIDFVQMAASANAALGEVTAPSALALRLDKKYQHILVDEFQDCNFSQVDFLAKLTAGWQTGDGRSLFLVGDKKQSIYMFRGSNVSVFTLVALNGINDMKFEVGRLENNYRSQAGLVEWVNEVFAPAFGTQQNLVIGSTDFKPSVARKAPVHENPVDIELFDQKGGLIAEAEYVSRKIKSIQVAEPDASIAVLARTRNDLEFIIAELRSASIGHRAVDIHKLGRQQATIDLTVLTRSIAHLADRGAWIGLLRSPVVGLSIGELETLVKGERGLVRPNDLIIDLIQSESVLNQLSVESQSRVKKLLRVMEQSLSQLDRKPLSIIVKGAYYELNGLSTLEGESELRNVEAFLKMLRVFDQSGFELERFENELSRLYATDEKSNGSVSLMTIHKAKGLEFDYVFIPGAHKPIRGDIARLIDTDTILSDEGYPTPVIAPSPEAGIKTPQINGVIRGFAKIKKSLEAVRTAYVGLTRSKVKMFITGLADASKEERRFVGTSILGVIGDKVPKDEAIHAGGEQLLVEAKPKRNVLANVVTPPLPENNVLAQYRGIINVSNEVLPEFDWCRDINRCVGILTHKALEDMAKQGIDEFFGTELMARRAKHAAQFKQLGLNNRLIPKALQKLECQLTNLKQDESLYWLMQPRLDANTEAPFILKEAGKRRTQIIDLTFKENGVRYFFDLKTSEPSPGETTQRFVTRMKAQYEQKMKQYRQCFPNEDFVRGALYLTSVNMIAWYDERAITAA